MDFGYFHEEVSEQFAFYRIPQVLFMIKMNLCGNYNTESHISLIKMRL